MYLSDTRTPTYKDVKRFHLHRKKYYIIFPKLKIKFPNKSEMVHVLLSNVFFALFIVELKANRERARELTPALFRIGKRIIILHCRDL